MFEYFEANPGLATGQLQKISYRKKWRELTSLLNAEGLGEKSTEKWQKVVFNNLFLVSIKNCYISDLE